MPAPSTPFLRRLAAAVALALSSLLASGLTLLAATPAAAAWPEQPIRLVVPFPPGGGADNLARTMMPRVEALLGQPIVIENRPGAGGNVGAEHVARAAPDGYTLLYGTNGTHAINAALYRQLRFDPQKDFVPVARLNSIPTLLIVGPQFEAQSVAELIRLARAQPGKINFASAGNGTTSHLAGEMFRTQAGIDIVHVPYRGGAAAATDLIGGQVQMMIEVAANALPLVRGGRVRALAVASAQRFPGAPDIPTVAESGLPGFDASAWDGIFAPAGTPRPVIERLNSAIREALADPALVESLRKLGVQPVPGTPEAFARHVAASSESWAAAVRASGAKVD
jgi:tripartite-type tricarboxylate transporter receptor subunit TctC